MFVLSNAWKSITRSKGRNILIAIIVIAIAASCSVALSIRHAAATAEAEGTSNLTITATIGTNRTSMVQNMQFGTGGPGTDGTDGETFTRPTFTMPESLTLEELTYYADSQYVTDFYYTGTAMLNAGDDIEPFSYSSTDTDSTTDTTDTETGEPNMPGGFTSGGRNGGSFMINSAGGGTDFTLNGVSSESAMTSFISGASTVTDGTVFDTATADYQCLISDTLAAYNGFSVGDTFTLTTGSEDDGDLQTYTLTISGIYSITTSDSQYGGFNSPFNAMSEDNQIYVSYATLAQITDEITPSAVYVLPNADALTSFQEEVTAKGLSDDYSVTSSDASGYENSLVPLKNLSSFATTLFLVILGVGALILIVLNIFNIRERKYEVGVYTAIGIHKYKVASQFVCELLIVTMIAIFLGVGVGAVAGGPIANNLLAAQVEAAESEQTNIDQNFGRATIGDASSGPVVGQGGNMQIVQGNFRAAVTDYVDTIEANTDLTVIGQMFAIGLALTLISSLAGIVFVMRYEPLKILAERA